DPYDLDIKLRDKLKEVDGKERDSIKRESLDVTTTKTFNLTNVKKIKTDGKRPKIWSVTNFDFNYSYIQTLSYNPLIERDEMRRTRGAVGYTYAPQVQPFEPFKKLIKSKSKWLALLKEFNLNYAPSQISFRADVFRQFGATRPRNVGGGPYKIPETYNKYFTFDRFYILQWNLTKSISIDFNAVNNARIDEPFGRIDNKVAKDSVRKNLLKGGRNTSYRQEVTITYNVPMQKIPLLDWTTLRASYNTKYNWLAGSLLARTPEIDLGNTLSNTQTRTINGEMNFEMLYNKSRFLRAVNTSAPKQPPANNQPGGDKNQPGGKGDNKKEDKKSKNNKTKQGDNAGAQQKDQQQQQVVPGMPSQQDTSKAKLSKKERRKLAKLERKQQRLQKKQQRKKDPNRPLPEISGVPKAFLQLATSLKRVGIQYTEDMGTTLPGYMDSTRVLGYNFKSRQPGFGYIFGYQPDTSWINRFGAKGLLSADTLVTAMIQQRYNQRLNLTAQVSPFRDFNIDINYDKTFDKQYSELYKDTSKFDNVGLTRLNPYALGSFNVSYIAFQTLFKKFDPNVVSETFQKFESNRAILSK
ncbi:MAG TPA: cell surface protein SprA, partial [Chitinophagaceae bacterium]|nr:cell surface protein SprA [Chitinophagaceae bacterium]